MTHQEILKKIAERKKLAEQTVAPKTVVRKPLIEKFQRKPLVERKVVSEKTLVNRPARTISESITQRVAKMPKGQAAMYKMLAENIAGAVGVISEVTQAGPNVSGAVGNGAGAGLIKTYFDIFFGYFPNLIAPLLASTQPINTPVAQISYYKSVAGVEKGSVASGQVLSDPFGVYTDSEFTSNVVTVGGLAAATSQSFVKPIWGPFIAKSVVIDGYTLTWATDTTFSGTHPTLPVLSAGSVTISGGNITIAFTLATAPAAGAAKVSYQYDNEYAPTQIPELGADIETMTITAKWRTVKTNFSFQAGVAFERNFGYKLADKLAEHAMFELKRAIDLEILNAIRAAAPTLVQWNQYAQSGLYQFHKESFRDAIASAANKIKLDSKRVKGNILVVGINAETVVTTLQDWKGADALSSSIGGAGVIGKLGDMTVISAPDLGADEFLVLHKDQKDNLNAGIVFAPYVPVMSTGATTLDDLVIRNAFVTAYGLKVVNNKYFVRGRVVNQPTAEPVLMMTKDGNVAASGNVGELGDDAVIQGLPYEFV